ncbi:MAG: phytanoyl-CoA dioxygenase family protein [Vampirovibrionales bacterium]|nr:phytanoyl-CoA dioxygenase family protein [Vampirovibrionales bacterium]
MISPIALGDAHACRAALDRDGFTLRPAALDVGETDALLSMLTRPTRPNQGGDVVRRGFAERNLLKALPELRRWLERPSIHASLTPVFGDPPPIVRAILFDKTPQSNWKVPWHQDLTINVRHRRECAGFENWRIRSWGASVQPPVEILRRMLTLRIHLDAADADNGALRLIPGSHRAGRLSDEQTRAVIAETAPVLCVAQRGDILAMRPLVLHASASGGSPHHRRILHLEFSPDALPGGLEWLGT